ncbi:hypothetical protein PSHT_10652 [Puccinia striiformis]|uniref:Uncharacterized protein n=1 Tax=Puccinia striiformis TaxID=27350 RepID=A0A2S4V874_9BASI|nr:hypothetical protein PSHT_10652 [Puccinia striiformis]
MEFTGDLPASTSSSAGLNGPEITLDGRLAASQGNYDDPNGEGIFVADRTIAGGRGWARLHKLWATCSSHAFFLLPLQSAWLTHM